MLLFWNQNQIFASAWQTVSMQLELFIFICSFLSEDVRKIIKKSEFYQTIDYNCLYFTIHEAVVIAQELNQQVGVRLFKKKSSQDNAGYKDKFSIVAPKITKILSARAHL